LPPLQHSINVYAIKDGAPRCRLDGHEGGVWALQYRGDVLVSGSTDRTVRIWSIEKGVQTHVFWGHTSTVVRPPPLSLPQSGCRLPG
jgi:F-box and WD-40 domain protein CDC4